ncbi:transposase [Haloprofundus marisrubri]|uniref:Transposase n=1 Tax=Haloprofundus marisrubri TaxID=1514971 RepID=A0A0W1RBC6_9EURY|nr:transposase [Haloprofundus marisrubri]
MRAGKSLVSSVAESSIQTKYLDDSYPEWHPAPHSFLGMVRLLIYREATGTSYRALARFQELAEPLGLKHIPDESVLSRTWRKRFDDGVREFVQVTAHFVIKQAHDREFSAPTVRPKAEIIDEVIASTDDETAGCEFSDEQIYRTTRLARDHGFDEFDSGRAANATYEDTQFFELQTFMGMVSCGTPQGAARFQYRHSSDGSPHGDTHLRTIKQFESEKLIDGFDLATDRLLSVIKSEASFRRPVTVAIDITTVPFYGDVEGMTMVSGLNHEERAFKFATLSIVGLNVPLILAVEPVRESSAWDDNPPNQIHRVVRQLVRRAKQHVPIETVLCDREFDSMRVFQTLSNLSVNYLIPKRITSTEKKVIETMESDGEDVAVESASVHIESGEHSMQFLYVPSTKGDGTAVFATNLRVGPKEAESFCQRYSRRWQIENEYKSIKNDFLAKTSSKDYRVRLFYFVFAVLLYNIWRLTDFLLKAGVDGEIGYAPILTAGECVEIVVSALIPPD